MILIVPSRGRPQNIIELHTAISSTAQSYVQLVVAVDNDDPKLDEYQAIEGIHLVIGEPKRLVPWLNELGPEFAEKVIDGELAGDNVIGFCGDDHRPRSAGFDMRIREALDELGTGIVYGNDLIQGENLPTAVFMTADIISTLGYMAPPTLVHGYADNAWKDLGNAIGKLKYLPDVIIEHVHPIAGKAEADELYEEVWELQNADFAIYQEYKSSGAFEQDVSKLKGLL